MGGVRNPRIPSVDAWCLTLNEADRGTEALAHRLSPGEEAALGRISAPARRRLARVAWSVRRTILAARLSCAPGDLVFARPARGAPRIASPKCSLRFSLSHSGTAVLFAISDSTQVGADIQQCDPQTDVVRLARRFFLGPEADEIAALDASLGPAPARERFFRIWARKEAVLKGSGGGVPSRLRDVLVPGEAEERTVVAGGNSWTVRDIPAVPGYVAAVAVDREAAIAIHRAFDVST